MRPDTHDFRADLHNTPLRSAVFSAPRGSKNTALARFRDLRLNKLESFFFGFIKPVAGQTFVISARN